LDSSATTSASASISGSNAIRSVQLRRCKRIGIGSGGFFGGATHGAQTQLDCARRRPTTSSVLGEELGFLSAMVLFAVRAAAVAWPARRRVSRDMFGRLLAAGIVTTILLQTFINVA
jgi:cell division protein FtsW (lipid II flippase)